MDCGDAGHILVSSAEAEVLGQVSAWCSMLHDLGEVEVKHGVRIHLCNLYNDKAGNSVLPKKISEQRAMLSSDGSTTKDKRLVTFTVAGMVLLAVVSIGGWLIFAHKAHPLSATDAIVLADFENKTGDPVFDDTLRQGLSVQLEQSPFLDLVSERKVNETLKLMGRPAGDRLTPEVTREVCQRTGSKAMLTGSIVGLGSQYVIGLKAVNCNTGDVLAEAQEQAASKEAVLKALDNAAVSLRSKLGESLSSVQKYATPVRGSDHAIAGGAESLQPGTQDGLCEREHGRSALLQAGRRTRPEFCHRLRRHVGCLQQPQRSRAGGAICTQGLRAAGEGERTGAVRHRGSLLLCTATGELEKAAQTYELWQQTYPRDYAPYTNLGIHFRQPGKLGKGIGGMPRGDAPGAERRANYANLGNAYANLNRLDEAEAVYKQAEERKLESETLLAGRYLLAFLKGDAPQMARVAFGRHGKAGHGRPAAGHASGHGGLVWEVEERTRTDSAGDGFSRSTMTPKRRRQHIRQRQRCARWNRETASRRAPKPMRH